MPSELRKQLLYILLIFLRKAYDGVFDSPFILIDLYLMFSLKDIF